MLKNRLIYLLVLLVLALFRIAYTGYAAGMMLVIALILPFFSWLISLPGALCTQIFMTVPDQIIRGSDAAIALTVRQSRLFATGQIRGRLRMQNMVSGEVSFAKLKSVKDGIPVNSDHCCVYRCRFTGFRVYDLTGLLPMPTCRPGEINVTVLPIPSEPPEHPDWSASGTLVARPFSGSDNPYDLRDYRIGDTLKAVHWKKSAALDKTVVRDTLEPAVRIATIWLDWTDNPNVRDVVADQLAWCMIYLEQNHAGLQLRWKDTDGKIQGIQALQGELDQVMPMLLCMKAGKRIDTAFMQAGDILLTATGEGAAT